MAKKANKKALAPLPQSPALDAPNARQYYQDLFDTLKDAYWEANDISRKDQVATARDHAYEILTALNQDDLATNTQAFLALSKNVAITNQALVKIQEDIKLITQRISTIASVLAAITKVLSIAPMFA